MLCNTAVNKDTIWNNWEFKNLKILNVKTSCASCTRDCGEYMNKNYAQCNRMLHYDIRASVWAQRLPHFDPVNVRHRHVLRELILTSCTLLCERVIKYLHILKGLILPVLTGRPVDQIKHSQQRWLCEASLGTNQYNFRDKIFLIKLKFNVYISLFCKKIAYLIIRNLRASHSRLIETSVVCTFLCSTNDVILAIGTSHEEEANSLGPTAAFVRSDCEKPWVTRSGWSASECRSREGNISVSYSGGPWYELDLNWVGCAWGRRQNASPKRCVLNKRQDDG
jgi:hypothetical protein